MTMITLLKEIDMSGSKFTSSQNKQSAQPRTEADEKGKKAAEKSSGNEKSRIKAGEKNGAGGGAKQKQKH